MKLNKILLSTALLSSLSFGIDYQFNYFGNISLTQIDKDGYKVRSTQGYDIENDHLDFRQYSKLGGQVLLFGDDYLLRTQATVRRNRDKYEAELTWLNAQYNLTNDFSIRVGRMQMPMFLNSDTLDIDYIHTWAKPPVELYALIPVKYYDGAEIHYQTNIGDTYLKFEVPVYGEFGTDLNTKGISTNDVEYFSVEYFRGIKSIIEYNDFRVSGSYYKLKSNMTIGNDIIDTAMATLNAYGVANNIPNLGNMVLSDVQEQFSWNNADTSVYSLGFDYYDGDYLFKSEYSNVTLNSIMPDMQGFYALAGFRYKQFTPYVSFAQHKNEEEHYKVKTLIDPTNGLFQAQLTQLQSQLESLLYMLNYSQKTTSIGLRYDYDKGIALKFQLDRITTQNYGNINTLIPMEYERLGFTGHKVGVEDKPLYQATVSLSFAF
jgi:hypothetical protein